MAVKSGRRKAKTDLPYSVKSVFVEVFSTEFGSFHFISLTFSLSDHPSPLLRQLRESRVPERAIRIRIINIISFHCDPLCGPLHTQGQDGANTVEDYPSACQSRLSPPHTYTHTYAPQWLNCSLRDDMGRGSGDHGGGGAAGPEGRHTMERAADQRSGEIELEIFHGWLA